MHLMHAEDSRLKRFYRQLARRKGRPLALVATARKLLVAIYWMLKRREPFRARGGQGTSLFNMRLGPREFD